MKKRIFNLIQKGAHGKQANLIFDYSIMVLIILSIGSIILESMAYPEVGNLLSWFNTFAVLVFSIEYLLRLYVSDLTHPSENKVKSAFKFIFSFYGIIDLLAILPFYLPMFIKTDLRFLRALRLTRILRILKMNRYNNWLHIITEVIKDKKQPLAITMFFAFIVLIISSFLMYFLEGEAQPEAFPNILAAFWWAIATLTTVGYGDIYPITAMGKLVSGIIAFLGIGIIALPTGLISAGFMDKVESTKPSACPHCGKPIN
jgi:voltage-gated potassium channel